MKKNNSYAVNINGLYLYGCDPINGDVIMCENIEDASLLDRPAAAKVADWFRGSVRNVRT